MVLKKSVQLHQGDPNIQCTCSYPNIHCTVRGSFGYNTCHFSSRVVSKALTLGTTYPFVVIYIPAKATTFSVSPFRRGWLTTLDCSDVMATSPGSK